MSEPLSVEEITALGEGTETPGGIGRAAQRRLAAAAPALREAALHYARLAEARVPFVEMYREAEAERDAARAENERHRKANLVRSVIEGWSEEKDGALIDYINDEGFDPVPWKIAAAARAEVTVMREEREQARDRLRGGWFVELLDMGDGEGDTYYWVHSVEPPEPMSVEEAAWFNEREAKDAGQR